MDKMPAWADAILVPLISILLAAILSALVILAIGEAPIEAVKLMVTGALGSSYGWGFTLYYATNFLFTGLAFAVASHAGLFNIGSEGQAMIGGLSRDYLSFHPLASLGTCPARCYPRRGGFRRALGADPRLASGETRQPHRDHHDHVQFHRCCRVELRFGQHPAARRLHGSGHCQIPRRRAPAYAA